MFVSVAAVEVVFDLDGSSAWAQAVIVAKVNGDPITDRELQRLLVQSSASRQIQQEGQPTRILPDPASPQKIEVPAADSKKLEQAALQRLIRFHLLLQEAARRNLAVTEKELTQAQAALRRRFKDDQSYAAWLKSQGLSAENSLRDALRSELLVARAAAALVRQTSFSEQEMRTYYEKHKSEFQVPATVRLQVIAVRDRAAADGVVTALKQGEDFGRLARERSTGFRAAQGGDLGWVAPDKLSPTLRMAAGTLKVGETSDTLPVGSELPHCAGDGSAARANENPRGGTARSQAKSPAGIAATDRCELAGQAGEGVENRDPALTDTDGWILVCRSTYGRRRFVIRRDAACACAACTLADTKKKARGSE